MHYTTNELIGLAQHFKSANWRFHLTFDFSERVSYHFALKFMKELENRFDEWNGTYFLYWAVVNADEAGKESGCNICVLLATESKLRQVIRSTEGLVREQNIQYKIDKYNSKQRWANWLLEKIFLNGSLWGFFFGGKSKNPILRNNEKKSI